MKSRGIVSFALIVLLTGCSVPTQFFGKPATPAPETASAQTETPAAVTATPTPMERTIQPEAAPTQASQPPASAPGATMTPVTPTDATSAPPAAGADAFTGAVLDSDGYGPIKVGMSNQAALRAGYFVPSDICGPYQTAPYLRNQGVELTPGETKVVEVSLMVTPDGKPAPGRTRSGARVGMTLAQVRKIYGSQFRMEVKEGDGGPFQAGVVRVGGRELVFVPAYGSSWQQTPNDSMQISWIVARDYSTEMHGGC